MTPLVQYVIRRLFAALVSLVVITMVLYAGVMLTPPEARARLFIPPGKGGDRISENYIRVVIETHHLNDPYIVQYGYWIQSLFSGSWGYSPTLRDDVLPALVHRTPATLELALFSLLVFVPLGLASGLLAGWKSNGWMDGVFRGWAFIGTSIPPFILAMVLLTLFYLKLGWFAPGRMDILMGLNLASSGYVDITGMYSIDSLLNGRLDLFWDALRHLAMPVMTVSLFQWATLGRVTRSLVIHQTGQDYILSARARGINEGRLAWRHAFRAVLAPALTTTVLSAASIISNLFIVEIIFGLTGISNVVVMAMSSSPDAPAALGFTVYSVFMVVVLMFILDLVQALIDPRVRGEVLQA